MTAHVVSSLSPKFIQKRVMTKNIHQRIHKTTEDITNLYPIRIVFYHSSGIKNVTEFNSKIPADYETIGLVKSQMWRRSLPEFRHKEFFAADRIFLEVHIKQDIPFY